MAVRLLTTGKIWSDMARCGEKRKERGTILHRTAVIKVAAPLDFKLRFRYQVKLAAFQMYNEPFFSSGWVCPFMFYFCGKTGLILIYLYSCILGVQVSDVWVCHTISDPACLFWHQNGCTWTFQRHWKVKGKLRMTSHSYYHWYWHIVMTIAASLSRSIALLIRWKGLYIMTKYCETVNSNTIWLSPID